MSQPDAGLCIERCSVVNVNDSTDEWDGLLPALYLEQLKLALPANEQACDELFEIDGVTTNVSKLGKFTQGH
jgi:hypothetical protein